MLDWSNLLKEKDSVTLEEYLNTYSNKISQDSERLFVRDFLYPLLGAKNIKFAVPQYPFIDSEGRCRRIDFGLVYEDKKIALEVNGETYHAEGIIPNEMFDDNLNRQNEILNAGWYLLRYSYTQLQSPEWRQKVQNSIFYLLRKQIPELLASDTIKPNYLQEQVLDNLKYYRNIGWKKGIVVLPTGTGKTFLSAFDTLNVQGRILFIVHKLDILTQSRESFEKIYPNEKLGLLTGEVKEHIKDSKVLFASKDSLRNPATLTSFAEDEFDYVIVDEVHHGSAPTYQVLLRYFQPTFFMLGLTATPDRMDRKDIFELFDYKKVYECSLNQAIEQGFLVPYTYYGLRDNIDYNKIKHNGTKYNIADLNKKLIIKERNERIYDEYLLKGEGNKALGFCCSISHANAMEQFFTSKGIPSVSITSETANREQIISDFRKSKYTIAFTVDLFNEGVDFPDLRVLLFLRPTESKTVFIQQLGRGLRLCNSKENVVVIDFIGNYKKAKNIRQYLSNSSKEKINQSNGRVEKIEYEYSPKCKVIFDAEVEEILDSQDTAARDITKNDLIAAYYAVAELLERKPTQEDINNKGEFKISRYFTLFGSWVGFLKEIGEHTESSYHFPQGTHLGHVLYIVNTIGTQTISGSRIDEQYVRFSGGFDQGGIGGFQRQTKYKIQACMELGLLVDFRSKAQKDKLLLAFTSEGKNVFQALKPMLETLDFSFKDEGNDRISWTMNCERSINATIREYLESNPKEKNVIRKQFLNMDAVSLLLKYLYTMQDSTGSITKITKSNLYNSFFEAPFVKEYLDRHGLENPTEEVRKRRVPFLINILEALGIVDQSSREISVRYFVPTYMVMKLSSDEGKEIVCNRITQFNTFILTGKSAYAADEVSKLKETFGKDFLTSNYHLDTEGL